MKTSTLLLGGARSGKSALAERLALSSGLALTYLATAELFDEEMRTRVAAHQARRGPEWQLIEAPLDLVEPLQSAPADSLVLLDSLGVWLGNLMHAGRSPTDEVDGLLDALEQSAASWILVSDEVGLSLHPETQLGRQFRDLLGLANQRLAHQAEAAALVVAGQPLILKGVLPHG